MDDLTLRLPGELREQLEAEAERRGVPVGEHIREIIAVHCRGEGTLERPALQIHYAHTVAESRSTDDAACDSDDHGEITEIDSFTYGTRSILS